MTDPRVDDVRRPATTDAEWADFLRRSDHESPRLIALLTELYGEERALELHANVIADAAVSWQDRPAFVREFQRDRDPLWFEKETALGGVCYVDLYAGDLHGVSARIPYFQELGLTYLHLMPLFAAPEGESDGGYAVSSYREIAPHLGTMADLSALAEQLHAAGIALVVDFVFNHTSDEHAWAIAAKAGDPDFADFYFIYPDREMPDAFERTTREIFPDDHAGSFTQLDDGRWVWTTFHRYQWDLNYGSPAVFRAMARELLFLANHGVDILRMDAVAFIAKRLGTTSENLPEAHLLLRAFNAVCRIAAPGLLFKSEAIVHPDEVVRYVDPEECQLSYNPLQMALLWSTLATRDVRMLAHALAERHALPADTAWVNYVRSHDDIGWTFSDEDARALGVDPQAHRRFLNDFFVGDFEGSFARGMPFQENPRTGDRRVAGTTASLAGLSQHDPAAVARIVLLHSVILSTGGVPLIYLGDEVGQVNDESFRDDPAHRDDTRWAGRPPYPAELYAQREDPNTEAGAIWLRLRHLIETRRGAPELAGGDLVPFDANNDAVLAYQRRSERAPGSRILVMANFADTAQTVSAATLSGMPRGATDLVSRAEVDLARGLVLEPHRFVWLRVLG